MILIVGASGKLGQEVARRVLKAGRPVRALSRRPEDRLIELKAAGAEVMAGDLRDPDSLRQACAGVTHVVASAHAIFGRGAERSALVDDQGHRGLIDAARAAGCGHFCYVSVLGASPDHPVALFEQIAGRPAKVSHVPRVVLRVMSPLLRPLHPGLSQVMALALYEDTHNTTFDAAPLLRRYPLTLTRLKDWIAEHCVPRPSAAIGSP
jgi:NAD(P)-dependent dehydrogenase (short-subunit alcohol dehydrogenase family)